MRKKEKRSIVKEIFGQAMYRLIEFGVPNHDGLVIQQHEISTSPEVLCLLTPPRNDYDIEHDEIAGAAKALLMPDGLYVSIKCWPGARGDLLRKSLHAGSDFLPGGAGCVDNNGYVWDYRLLYLLPNIKTDKNDRYNPI